MLYISYNDLIKDIKDNFQKIPRDIAGVIGIPRSGLIPATIISQLLNVGMCVYHDFLQNGDQAFVLNHGQRKLSSTSTNKILVVDDTCYSGTQMLNIKNELINKYGGKYQFIFMPVYLEGDAKKCTPDLYLRDLRQYAQSSELRIVFYEYNIFNHHKHVCDKILYDLDGVICKDPPYEENEEKYLEYLKHPETLRVPAFNREISICTYRLNKYFDLTSEYLTSLGLKCHLYMYNAPTKEERNKVPPYEYKAYVYSHHSEFVLFVESEDWQAQKIFEITGKSVFCPTTNKMYTKY